MRCIHKNRKFLLLCYSLIAALVILTAFASVSVVASPAQESQEYTVVAKAPIPLSEIADKFFGEPNYWPAVMAATNRKYIEDPSFTRISDPERIEPGWKLWIPDKEWADGFMKVWTPAKPELLFGVGPRGQLVVASWWTAGGEAEGLKGLFDIYRSKYPDVEIVNATVAGGAGYVFRAVIKPRLIAGDPPDTFQLHAGLEVEGYSPETYLQPLDDLYAIEGWKNVFPPDLLKLLEYKEHYWGVPVNIHRSNVLWYDKSIFARAGLIPPRTWDEFFDVSETLKVQGIVPIAMGTQGGWEAGHVFEDILAGVLGAEKYKGLWTGVTPWTDPLVTQALKIYKRMLTYVNTDHSALSWDGAGEYMIANKGAMMIMGDWANGWFMAKGYTDYGWAPVPDTKGIFVALSDTFSLPKMARNRDNVIAWLRVSGSKEGQEAFNTKKGSIPARMDADPSLFNEYLQSTMKDWKTDAIVPSLIHGAAAIESWVADYKDVINLFIATGDVSATQAALQEASVTAGVYK